MQGSNAVWRRVWLVPIVAFVLTAGGCLVPSSASADGYMAIGGPFV